MKITCTSHKDENIHICSMRTHLPDLDTTGQTLLKRGKHNETYGFVERTGRWICMEDQQGPTKEGNEGLQKIKRKRNRGLQMATTGYQVCGHFYYFSHHHFGRTTTTAAIGSLPQADGSNGIDDPLASDTRPHRPIVCSPDCLYPGE